MPTAHRLPRLAAAALLVATAAGATPAPLDAGKPRWERLDFAASRLLLTASARVDARLLPAAAVAPLLLPTPAGIPVAPAGPEVVEMLYTASGLGLASVTTLYLDPASGAALQRRQVDTSGGERVRVYRFTDAGAYHYTRRPAGREQRKLPPEQWTDLSEGMRPYPAGAAGRPVTEATALLWLVAAGPLGKAGDRMEALTFSRRQVHRVTAEVTGERQVQVDFTETDAGATRRRRGDIGVLVVRVRGAALDPADGDESFELLGLRGDLELLLEPRQRLPLALRGRIKVLGDVTVELRAAVLRQPPPPG